MDTYKSLTPTGGKGEEQETRDRILSAARSIMSTKGFKGATTRLIAETAGVNEVTIFRHFGNKERILTAIIDQFTLVGSYLEKKMEKNYENVEDMLKEFGQGFYNKLLENKEIWMLCMIEGESRPDLVLGFSKLPLTAVKVLQDRLTLLHEQGKLPKGDFAAAAHMYTSSFFASFMLLQRVGVKNYVLTEENMFNRLSKILINGLLNPEI